MGPAGQEAKAGQAEQEVIGRALWAPDRSGLCGLRTGAGSVGSNCVGF